MTEEYTIYGVYYVDRFENKTFAVIAAESDKNAISLLEQAVQPSLRGTNFDPVAEETRFKTSKKGIVFGYDSFSDATIF